MYDSSAEISTARYFIKRHSCHRCGRSEHQSHTERLFTMALVRHCNHHSILESPIWKASKTEILDSSQMHLDGARGEQGVNWQRQQGIVCRIAFCAAHPSALATALRSRTHEDNTIKTALKKQDETTPHKHIHTCDTNLGHSLLLGSRALTEHRWL